MFFNILKNGCLIEALQLPGIDRLERALALFIVVSWRIAHLMRTGRTCPDLDALLFFDPDEIRGPICWRKRSLRTSRHLATRHGCRNYLAVITRRVDVVYNEMDSRIDRTKLVEKLAGNFG